jgi:hypothetical protein
MAYHDVLLDLLGKVGWRFSPYLGILTRMADQYVLIYNDEASGCYLEVFKVSQHLKDSLCADLPSELSNESLIVIAHRHVHVREIPAKYLQYAFGCTKIVIERVASPEILAKVRRYGRRIYKIAVDNYVANPKKMKGYDCLS